MNTKRYFALATLIAIAAASTVWAEDKGGEAILGNWTNSGSDDQATFQIYKEGDKYFGKIVSLVEEVYAKDDPEAGVTKHDRHNPDKSLQSRPILGIKFLLDFTYDGDNKWSGGTIYDPESGKTYKCKMTLKDDTLNVRGYIGISLLGRTEVWTRVKENTPPAAKH